MLIPRSQALPRSNNSASNAQSLATCKSTAELSVAGVPSGFIPSFLVLLLDAECFMNAASREWVKQMVSFSHRTLHMEILLDHQLEMTMVYKSEHHGKFGAPTTNWGLVTMASGASPMEVPYLIWWLLMVVDGCWWLLMVVGRYAWFLMVVGGCWRLLMAMGGKILIVEKQVKRNREHPFPTRHSFAGHFANPYPSLKRMESSWH